MAEPWESDPIEEEEPPPPPPVEEAQQPWSQDPVVEQQPVRESPSAVAIETAQAAPDLGPIARNAGEALGETISGLIPKTAGELGEFAVGTFAPAVQAVRDIGTTGQSVYDVLFGGKSIEETNAANRPEAATLAEVDQTPAFSKERFKAGFDVLAQMGMAAAVGRGLQPKGPREVLFPEEKPEVPTELTEATTKVPIEEIKPAEEVIPNASEITSPEGATQGGVAPERMSPDDILSPDKAYEYQKGQVRSGDTILRAQEMAESVGKSGEFRGEYGANKLHHASTILTAAEDGKPVNAPAVEKYGLKLPDGYEKQGDLYIKSSPVSRPTETTTAQPLTQKEVTPEARQGVEAQPTEKIDQVAIRNKQTGEVTPGVNHTDAYLKVSPDALDANEWSGIKRELTDNYEHGFVTNSGEFVSREQAHVIAKGKSGELAAEDLQAKSQPTQEVVEKSLVPESEAVQDVGMEVKVVDTGAKPVSSAQGLVRHPVDEIYDSLLNKAVSVGPNLYELSEKQITPATRRKLNDRPDVFGRPKETDSFSLKPKSEVTGISSDRGWILKDKKPDFIRRAEAGTKPASTESALDAYLKSKGFDPADAPVERLPDSEMKKFPITRAILDFETKTRSEPPAQPVAEPKVPASEVTGTRSEGAAPSAVTMSQKEYIAASKPEVPADEKVYASLYRQDAKKAFNDFKIGPEELKSKIGEDASSNTIRFLEADERQNPGMNQRLIQRRLDDGEYVSPEWIAKYPDLKTKERPAGSGPVSESINATKSQKAELIDLKQEPWRMTRGEALSKMSDQDWGIQNRQQYGPGALHRRAVEGALAEGKPVPSEVLADYPDLASKTDTGTQPVSGAKSSPKIADLQKAYDKAAGDLEAIGPEPHKPSPEKRFFGTKGREGHSPEVVQRYDTEVKNYNRWRSRYSKLKKQEVAASNELFYAKQADKTNLSGSGESRPASERSGVNSQEITPKTDTGTQPVSPKAEVTEPPPATPEAPPVEAPITPQKPSKIGKSIETKAVEAKLTQGFGETAGYDPITIADQAQRATNLIKSSPADARAIVRGETPLPEGLRGTSLITAMEEQLLKKPDAQLAYELANSPLTSATSAAAQEMRLMSERVPDSLAAKFQEIREAREAGSKKRGETTERLFKDIQKEVVRQSSKRPTWEAFVREITC